MTLLDAARLLKGRDSDDQGRGEVETDHSQMRETLGTAIGDKSMQRHGLGRCLYVFRQARRGVRGS